MHVDQFRYLEKHDHGVSKEAAFSNRLREMTRNNPANYPYEASGAEIRASEIPVGTKVWLPHPRREPRFDADIQSPYPAKPEDNWKTAEIQQDSSVFFEKKNRDKNQPSPGPRSRRSERKTRTPHAVGYIKGEYQHGTGQWLKPSRADHWLKPEEGQLGRGLTMCMQRAHIGGQ